MWPLDWLFFCTEESIIEHYKSDLFSPAQQWDYHLSQWGSVDWPTPGPWRPPRHPSPQLSSVWLSGPGCGGSWNCWPAPGSCCQPLQCLLQRGRRENDWKHKAPFEAGVSSLTLFYFCNLRNNDLATLLMSWTDNYLHLKEANRRTYGIGHFSLYREDLTLCLLAFTDNRAWLSRRNAGFAGRGEIVTDALSKLFSILTIGKGFESGSLHQLHSLKGIFPICVHMCSLYRKKSSQSACFNFNICPWWIYNFAFFPLSYGC